MVAHGPLVDATNCASPRSARQAGSDTKITDVLAIPKLQVALKEVAVEPAGPAGGGEAERGAAPWRWARETASDRLEGARLGNALRPLKASELRVELSRSGVHGHSVLHVSTQP